MRIRRNAKLPSAASSRKGEVVLHRSSMSATSETDDATPHALATASRTGEIAEAEATVAVLPARYVLLQLATALTGYTVKAIQRKIERGDWAGAVCGDTLPMGAS